jgi:HlyD family secretion protein
VGVRLEIAHANLDAVLAGPRQGKLAVAQAQIDSTESAIYVLESHIKQLTHSSMIDGIVLEGLIEPGEVASPGAPLFALAQLNDLTITVFVPEDRYGGKCLLRRNSRHQNVRAHEGHRSTTFAIKNKIDNPEGKLKPGMHTDVN